MHYRHPHSGRLIASVSLCGVLASKYNASKKLRGNGVLLDGSSPVFKAGFQALFPE